MDSVPNVIVVLAALAIYLPVVVVPYAFLDDYSNLAVQHGAEGNVWRFSVRGGRPIGGLLLYAGYSAVPNIDALRFMRLISLVGIALLGIVLIYALRKSGLNRWLATGISVSVISIPSFQVYVSWAVLLVAPLAAVLSGVAALRASSAFGLPPRQARQRWAQAVGLLLVALLMYQPAAMFFWVFTAIEVLRPSASLSQATRKLASNLAVGILAMACGLAAAEIGAHVYGSLGSGRSSITHDVVGKLRWFLDEPLVNGLNVFDLSPTRQLAGLVAAVVITGLLLLHIDKGRSALGFLGIAAILIPLSYVPNLAVEENWASYRSLGALSALLVLYVWLGLWGVVRAAVRLSALHGRRLVAATVIAVGLAALLSSVLLAVVFDPLWNIAKPKAADVAEAGWHIVPLTLLFATFLGLGLWLIFGRSRISFGEASARRTTVTLSSVFGVMLAVTGCLLAARNVTTLFVRPQSIELEMLRSALDRSDSDPVRRVVLTQPHWRQGAAPIVRYDEFGLPSTYAPWVPVPAVSLILTTEQGQKPSTTIETLPWTARAPTVRKPGEVVIDMRKLRDRREGWRLWTLKSAAG